MTGALDGHSQLTLVAGAGTGHSAGERFCSLAQVSSQAGNIFVDAIFSMRSTQNWHTFSALSGATSFASFSSFHGTKPPYEMM